MTVTDAVRVEVASAALAAVLDLLPADYSGITVSVLAQKLHQGGLHVDGQRLMAILDCLAAFGLIRLVGNRGHWCREGK